MTLKMQEVLDQIRASLYAVQARLIRGLEATAAPKPKSNWKIGVIKSTVRGLIGAFFLMALVLLGQRVILDLKRYVKNSNSGGSK